MRDWQKMPRTRFDIVRNFAKGLFIVSGAACFVAVNIDPAWLFYPVMGAAFSVFVLIVAEILDA